MEFVLRSAMTLVRIELNASVNQDFCSWKTSAPVEVRTEPFNPWYQHYHIYKLGNRALKYYSSDIKTPLIIGFLL